MQAPEEMKEMLAEVSSPDRLASPIAELADHHDVSPSDHLPASMAAEPVSSQESAVKMAATEGPATPMQGLGSLRRSGTMPQPCSIGLSDAASDPLVPGSPQQASFQRDCIGHEARFAVRGQPAQGSFSARAKLGGAAAGYVAAGGLSPSTELWCRATAPQQQRHT